MHNFALFIHPNNGDNMENKDPYFNQCILCTVKDCSYHKEKDNHCSLAKIMVASENKTTTHCASYQKRCD